VKSPWVFPFHVMGCVVLACEFMGEDDDARMSLGMCLRFSLMVLG